ncbi:MAG: 5-(carboxyamino)imidazole ribonucleotide synthase, partial [Pseudomonadales bacterium]|nr:5-(carboxyamino)imidazole ribonucleotide synthase [Pseudomonadales bacterium]
DNSPIDGLGDVVVWQPGMSGESFYAALGEPDAITFEKEQVNPELVQLLAHYHAVYPSPDILATCAHRLQEKQLLDRLNIPTAPYCYADSHSQLAELLANFTLPVVVKSTTDGYDGKNQWRIYQLDDIQQIPDDAIAKGVIAEAFIQFNAEASMIGVRDRQGHIAFYPATENVHSNGILARSVAPAPSVSEAQQQAMQKAVGAILEHSGYVGVLAAEFFITDDGILVNELAPRVHNSGHWTQQGTLAGQFDNHIRAVSGMALGDTAAFGPAGMVNIIGSHTLPQQLIDQHATLHWYNKVGKSGRKIGHVNVIADSHDSLNARMDSLAAALPIN